MATKAAKQRAREYVRAIRAKTVCVRCGRTPVDFHREGHEADHNQRIGPMMGRGCSVAAIAAELALCTPLCRRCHMREDGRSARLTALCPMKKGVVIVGPRPCVACGTLAKPLRRGLCNRCNHRKRTRERKKS